MRNAGVKSKREDFTQRNRTGESNRCRCRRMKGNEKHPFDGSGQPGCGRIDRRSNPVGERGAMDQREGIVRSVGKTKGRVGVMMILACRVIDMTFMIQTFLQSPSDTGIEDQDGQNDDAKPLHLVNIQAAVEFSSLLNLATYFLLRFHAGFRSSYKESVPTGISGQECIQHDFCPVFPSTRSPSGALLPSGINEDINPGTRTS